MEIIILLLLTVINGIFAMSEIAIISARKSKVQQAAQSGNTNAKAALDLINSPNKFLSTVQVGITLIGIIAGAFGATTLGDTLAAMLYQIPFLAPFSNAIAITIVVALVTFLSLVLGELVPKRLALNNPEAIALFMARPMQALSSMSAPLVSILSISTDAFLRLFGIKSRKDPSVSEEEVRMLIKEGTKAGIFNTVEKDIFERTLLLGDKKVNRLMTTRKEIAWLDIDSTHKTLQRVITKNPHTYFPVCKGSIDKVVGMVRTKDLLINLLAEEKITLPDYLLKPLFVPESMDAMKLLELFKQSGMHIALVVDEYGNMQGLVSLKNVLEAIVGDISTVDEPEDKDIVRRDNGTWFIDGLVSIDKFKEHFKIKKLPDEKAGLFHTIGGFVMHRFGHIPTVGEAFEFGAFRFEVVDMDGNRIDKILLVLAKKK